MAPNQKQRRPKTRFPRPAGGFTHWCLTHPTIPGTQLAREMDIPKGQWPRFLHTVATIRAALVRRGVSPDSYPRAVMPIRTMEKRKALYAQLANLNRSDPLQTEKQLGQQLHIPPKVVHQLLKNLTALRIWYQTEPRPAVESLARQLGLFIPDVLQLGNKLERGHFKVLKRSDYTRIDVNSGVPLFKQGQVIRLLHTEPELSVKEMARRIESTPTAVFEKIHRARKRGLVLPKKPHGRSNSKKND